MVKGNFLLFASFLEQIHDFFPCSILILSLKRTLCQYFFQENYIYLPRKNFFSHRLKNNYQNITNISDIDLDLLQSDVKFSKTQKPLISMDPPKKFFWHIYLHIFIDICQLKIFTIINFLLDKSQNFLSSRPFLWSNMQRWPVQQKSISA